jgi:hypothetical protein
MLVGVISDTHRALPQAVHAAFEGVGHIIHAGDIGAEWILDELGAIAPVTAVSGNDDSGILAWRLPALARVELEGCSIVVAHKRGLVQGSLGGADVAVYGHTHAAHAESVGGVVFLNPGPAGGDVRSGRRHTVAVLDCAARPPKARFIEV